MLDELDKPKPATSPYSIDIERIENELLPQTIKRIETAFG
jgi:hypothetical protein